MTDSDTVVYLGLGSNVGDRKANLAAALARLEPDIRVEAVSSLYETAPVGPQDQDDFYNAACRARTALTAEKLLARVQEIEREVGRTRTERWGPREIDIDVLLYGDEVIEALDMRVPHPEMTRRGFVLVPLAEIAADVRHPVDGRSIAELAAAIDDSGVRPIERPGWER